MAEGIQMSSFSSKFFCHRCRREVSPFHTAELICPQCSSGFLEEVSKELYETEITPDNCDDDDDSDLNEISFLPEIEGVGNLISRMIMNVTENHGHNQYRFQDDYDAAPPLQHPLAQSGENELDSIHPFVSFPPPHSRSAENELEEFHAFPTLPALNQSDSFNDIMRHFSMRSILAEDEAESEFVRLRIASGIDDYIDDEVDALTSQLLDEVEVSGPPPLSKEQIKSLPVVSVSRQQVEKGAQCTICMEDLSVREKVKSLPCAHLYHDKCIIPWLQRQATCPNCRDVVEIQPLRRSGRSRSCPRGRLRSGSVPNLSAFNFI